MRFNPSCNWAEGLWFDAVEETPALDFGSDKTGVAQHGKMLGDRRQAQLERRRQVTHALRLSAQHVKQLPTDRMRNRAERIIANNRPCH
jgi:hypothetical protein